jgi:hypothetical protein
MKTWHIEFLIAVVVLVTTTFLFADNLVNWITTVAVCLTFGYTQISDRMMERQKVMENPTVDCYWKLNYYFWGKEALWITAFILMQNYAALVGCFIFAVYPFWRKFYRLKIKPI